MAFESGFDIYEVQFTQGEVVCVRVRDRGSRDTYDYTQRDGNYDVRRFFDGVAPGMREPADPPLEILDVFRAGTRKHVAMIWDNCTLTELRPDLEERVT